MLQGKVRLKMLKNEMRHTKTTLKNPEIAIFYSFSTIFLYIFPHFSCFSDFLL